MKKFISHSLKDTEMFAEKIAGQLCQGKVVLLFGDLGAGKTTFSKSLIKALGFNGVVTSPTFTIVNQYEGEIPISHFDMYRLESEDEAFEIGVDEILQSGQNVCIVEWPEKVMSLFSDDTLKIHINILDENTREFVLEGFDENSIV